MVSFGDHFLVCREKVSCLVEEQYSTPYVGWKLGNWRAAGRHWVHGRVGIGIYEAFSVVFLQAEIGRSIHSVTQHEIRLQLLDTSK